MAYAKLQGDEVTARWHNRYLACTVFFFATTALFSGLFGGYYSAWKNRPPCDDNQYWVHGNGTDFDDACFIVEEDGLYAIEGATCSSECDTWWHARHPQRSTNGRRLDFLKEIFDHHKKARTKSPPPPPSPSPPSPSPSPPPPPTSLSPPPTAIEALCNSVNPCAACGQTASILIGGYYYNHNDEIEKKKTACAVAFNGTCTQPTGYKSIGIPGKPGCYCTENMCKALYKEDKDYTCVNGFGAGKAIIPLNPKSFPHNFITKCLEQS